MSWLKPRVAQNEFFPGHVFAFFFGCHVAGRLVDETSMEVYVRGKAVVAYGATGQDIKYDLSL